MIHWIFKENIGFEEAIQLFVFVKINEIKGAYCKRIEISTRYEI